MRGDFIENLFTILQQFYRPQEIMFDNWRLLESPLTPASTLALAAASMAH
jgi:hypothetical protein